MSSKLADTTSIDNIQSHSVTLGVLFRQANAIAQLENILNQCLPENLKNRFKIAGYKEGSLILFTSSASMLTALRFHEDRILQEFRRIPRFTSIKRLTIKIRPVSESARPKRKMQPISKENARLLRSEAGQTKDRDLREALLRLSRHTKKDE